MSLNCNATSSNYNTKINLTVKQESPNINRNVNNKHAQQDVFEKQHSNYMLMTESVIKKHGNVFNGHVTEYSGSINNKNINLTSKEGLTIFANANVQGAIADKPIKFTYNNKSFTGNYDGIEFDLKFEKDNLLEFFAGKKISGTINGKEIELNLKNSKIPEDENTRDIIATFLMIKGYAPKIKNGQFSGIRPSNWRQKEEEAAYIMMYSGQPTVCSTTTYTPTWHYDNPTCPTYY